MFMCNNMITLFLIFLIIITTCEQFEGFIMIIIYIFRSHTNNWPSIWGTYLLTIRLKYLINSISSVGRIIEISSYSTYHQDKGPIGFTFYIDNESKNNC